MSKQTSTGEFNFHQGDDHFFFKRNVQAFQYYQKAVIQSYPPAYLRLACMYLNGQGLDKSLDQSIIWQEKVKDNIQWFQIRANSDDAEVQYLLGLCYQTGVGIEKDEKQAVVWYRKSAEQGNIWGQRSLADCYLNGKGVAKDEKQSVVWIRKLAEQGNIVGQCWLGDQYRNGSGIERDQKEAITWYRKAAEQGYPDAQINLAVCYALGEGVSKDQKEAAIWYGKAAEQGDSDAQFNLGYCYALGEGVPKDQKEAAIWFRKSAEQGNPNAQFNLGNCYALGEGISQDLKEAMIWYHKAAEQGIPAAQVILGYYYAKGKGVPKDQEEAVIWYRAEQGQPDAQFNLGVCYAKGEGVEKDQKEAVTWYHKAAEQGNSDAQFILGNCYAKGEGVLKDQKEAAIWYRKAAIQGNPYAQTILSLCYATGIGVPRDHKEAAFWVQKVAEQGCTELLNSNSTLAQILSQTMIPLPKLSEIELKINQEEIEQQLLIQPSKSEMLPAFQSSQILAPSTNPAVKLIDQTKLNQLLQYVAEGEEDNAEELIKKDKNLLLHAGTVTDLSGREFKQITAFQYALWAMDWHMWTMIQKYLPKEAQAEQFQALESKGTMHGKHFNLQGLIGALQTYVDNYDNWSGTQCGEHWRKVVGAAQKELPVHVVNEYCRSDRPFEPCPSEWEAKLSRTRELEIWDSTQSKYVKGSWFIPSSSKDGLGLSYAFYRYRRRAVAVCRCLGGDWVSGGEAYSDLKALQSLWKTRTQQLESLKTQLLSTTNQDQELQTELKELKYETPVQPPKSTPPISQFIPQTILPPPKPQITPQQLALQDQLITACKQGDEKRVKSLLQQGAKPDIANAEGEQPLGAAVWGMCPDVVNTLLKQVGGVAPMTWHKCEQHNKKYYNNEVFIVPKFDPRTFGEWNDLLQKMDLNPFIRALHLKEVDEQWHDSDSSSWENLKEYVGSSELVGASIGSLGGFQHVTEKRFESFRVQIKKEIETAKQPTAELQHAQESDLKHQPLYQPQKSTSALPLVSQTISQTLIPPPKLKSSPEQLTLQDQLIAACKQGDAKTVIALLKRGAGPDIANAKGEHPLGAAVWGMCPDVVNALLKQAGGVAPMTWQECKQHNFKYYKEEFIVPKFAPQTYGEWYQLLLKIDLNPFIRAFHLKNVNEQWHNDDSSSWEHLKGSVGHEAEGFLYRMLYKPASVFDPGKSIERVWPPQSMSMTETGFVSFRTQIKRGIESAKQPTKQQSQTGSISESQTCLLM